MRILVCVKQVPDEMNVRLAIQTRTLARATMPSCINPFDLYALEAASRLKDAMPDVHISALGMGPKQAKSVLRDAMAFCADDAYLICDDRLAGADLRLATRVMRQAVKFLEEKDGTFDLVFTGAKSSDGGTAMFAPMLAARLGRPCIERALTVELTARENVLRICQDAEEADRVIDLRTPAVISVTKASFQVRYPDIARILDAERREIPVLDGGFVVEPAVDTAALYMPAVSVRSFRYRPLKKSTSILRGTPESVTEKLVAALAGKGLL